MSGNPKEILVKFLVYKDGKKYVGVCLTFDIVEEGKNPFELMHSLERAAAGHIRAVIKEGLSEELFNRPAPARYQKKYQEALKTLEQKTKRRVNNPLTFSFSFPQNRELQKS